MPPQHYIFNHVPKTGGNSLLAVCRGNLDPADIGPHLNEHDIRLLPAARIEHYRLITGHFSVLTQTAFCRTRYSMTLLRDPIKRIFSAYTFWRTTPEHNPVTSKAKELSFTEFVRYFIDSPSIVHNSYTHHFAAIGRDCPSYPCNSEALLAAAKHNLAAFDFVGVCEQMGRSAELLCRELGWRLPPATPHENRSWSENSFGQVDGRTMDLLGDRTRLDLELYDYAVQLLHAREDRTAPVVTSRHVERNRFVPFPIPYEVPRRAMVQSVSARWVPDESSRTLEVAVTFATKAPVAELSLGIRVDDTAGNIVWGTNTWLESLDPAYEIGRDSRAVFLLDCALPRGVYFVTVALAEPRRLGFHEHWIDHAALFAVAPPRVAPSRYVRGMRLQEFRSALARNVDGQ